MLTKFKRWVAYKYNWCIAVIAVQGVILFAEHYVKWRSETLCNDELVEVNRCSGELCKAIVNYEYTFKENKEKR